MAMTDYRRTRADEPDSAWVGALRKEVAKEMRAEMTELRKEVQRLREALAGKQTSVHVAPPSVSVAAPSVDVKAPIVNVAAADVDLGEIGVRFASLEKSMTKLTETLLMPMTRTVHRDENGKIKSMTEKRGK